MLRGIGKVVSMTKYAQVAVDLREAIHNGSYQPGDQLPLERELCARYGVSRITVKRAVDELVNEGLIVKRRGAGTFVKTLDGATVRDLSGRPQFNGFTESFAGHLTRTHVLRFEIIHPREEISEKLHLAETEFIYDIERLRCADGEPVVIEYTQMPISLIPGLKQENLHQSIYHFIERELKLTIQSAHRTIRALMPDPEEKKLLEMPDDLPLLEIEQVAFLDDGCPFEYSISHHRADKMAFHAVSIR